MCSVVSGVRRDPSRLVEEMCGKGEIVAAMPPCHLRHAGQSCARPGMVTMVSFAREWLKRLW